MNAKRLARITTGVQTEGHERQEEAAEAEGRRPAQAPADGGHPNTDGGCAGKVGGGAVLRPDDGDQGGSAGVHDGERYSDPAPGYVYLIEGPGGLFKIGRSVNPIVRMSQIAPKDAGLELLTHISTGDSVWLERYLHESFSHRRVKGEWFYLSVADVRLFKSIQVEVNHVDCLPSEVVSQWVLNESRGFQWGEKNERVLTPGAGGFMVRLTEEEHTMLKELADANDRKIVAELRIALRTHFRTNGRLPQASST